MKPEAILAAMRKQREFVVDLGGDKRVTLRRPTELEIQTVFVKLQPGATPEDPPKSVLMADPATIHLYAVGWQGVTEADLIGTAGGDAEAPFDVHLLQEWLSEHPDYTVLLLKDLLESIVSHINAQVAAEKN